MSPGEILKSAKRKSQGLGLATVYRAIKSMVEAGEIVEVPVVGEPPRYEPAGRSHHHHFLCRCCGKLFEVPGCPGDLHALVPKGFVLETHDLTLIGRCEACRDGSPAHTPAAAARSAAHRHGSGCSHHHH